MSKEEAQKLLDELAQDLAQFIQEQEAEELAKQVIQKAKEAK